MCVPPVLACIILNDLGHFADCKAATGAFRSSLWPGAAGSSAMEREHTSLHTRQS